VDPAFTLWREAAIQRGYKSNIALPLKSEGQILGDLAIYSVETDAFDTKEVDILKELADDLAFGITALRTRAKRDRAEEALKEQYSTLRSIIDSTDASVFSVDRLYRYTSFNNGHAAVMKAMYGAKIEINHNLLDYMTVTEDREKAGRNINRALAGGGHVEASYSGEEKLSRLYFEVSHNPVFAQDGSVIGVVVFAQDITDRKRAEEALRRLNAELEQRVRERTAQLEIANKELEAFSYSVSHDLRAPLRGIDGWSLALQEEYGAQLGEQGQTYINTVRSETQRMGKLIDDMLQLSRLTRAEMRTEQVDLSTIAETIATRLQEADPRRRVEFIIQKGLHAHCDANLMEAALSNLLDNAFKFTGKIPQARIDFGQTTLEGKLAFYVRDNGAGFDMAFAGKLFGAFQRMHRASEFPGTGVGLAIVQRIVHRHGGRVWVESSVDQGATFYFTVCEGL
jgi:PAS domain S-box-containing protein